MDKEEQIRAYYHTLFQAWGPQHYGDSLGRMFAQPTAKLRQELLGLNGVGPETADSILLYAGQHPIFVVDAYTRRMLGRHGILPENAPYEVVRNLCEGALARVPARGSLPPLKIGKQELLVSHRPSPMSLAERSLIAQAYNDMHGLIVQIGKHYCLKARPRCERYPLRQFLPA